MNNRAIKYQIFICILDAILFSKNFVYINCPHNSLIKIVDITVILILQVRTFWHREMRHLSTGMELPSLGVRN